MQPPKSPRTSELDVALEHEGDDLDDDERAALHRSIEEGVQDFEKRPP